MSARRMNAPTPEAAPQRTPAAIDRTPPTSLLGAKPLVISDPARVQNAFTDGALDPRYTRAQRLGMYRGAPVVVGSATVDAAAAKALSDGNVLAGELGGATLASLTAQHGYAAASTFGGRLALTAKLMTSSLDFGCSPSMASSSGTRTRIS